VAKQQGNRYVKMNLNDRSFWSQNEHWGQRLKLEKKIADIFGKLGIADILS